VILAFRTVSLSPSGNPKILIIYDLEGVSGVNHCEMAYVEEKIDYTLSR